MPVNFMNEVKKLPIVVRYELLKQVRRFRLYGLLILGSLVTGVAAAILLLTIPSDADPLYFSQQIISYGGVSLFGLAAGVFFSGDAIASEFEQKTGYVMFVNPIRRTTLLVGKYVSCCVASMLVVSMPYLITAIGVIAKFGTLPTEVLLSYVFALLFVCSVVSFTFIFSSLFKGSMGATVLPFLTFLFVFSIIQSVSMFAKFEPFMLLTYGEEIVISILSVPYPEHVTTLRSPIPGINFEITTYTATVAEGIAIMMSYLVVGLIISALIMKRRQMA